MQKHFFLIVSLLFSLCAQSQRVSINNDGSPPHPNAILDIKSGDKGLLIPRGDAATRAALSNNDAKGLMLLDTVTNTLWIHNGNGFASGWQQMSKERNTINSNVIIMYSSNYAYAFFPNENNTYEWLSVPLSGGYLGSVAANNSVVIYTYSTAYAFYRDGNGAGHWLSLVPSSSISNVVASSNTIVAYANYTAYGFYQSADGVGHWMPQNISGGGGVSGNATSSSNILVYSSTTAYMFYQSFDGVAHWSSQIISPAVSGRVVSANNIVVYSSGTAYGFYQDSNGNGFWSSKAATGNIIGGIGN